MINFFIASGLIIGISLVIISYYWLKQFLIDLHDKKLILGINKKYITDEKEFLRNYISFHLPLLIDNEIQWLMIWPKSFSEVKAEITYNKIKSKINVKIRNINSLEKYQADLLNLGVSEFQIKHDSSIFLLLPNAKIITDSLYFIFENIYGIKKFSNHKIITSATNI